MSADRFPAVGLDGKAHFIAWGPIQISLANLVMIAFIVALLVLAIVLPFPNNGASRDRAERQPDRASQLDPCGARARRTHAAPDKLLPDRQPGTSRRGSTSLVWRSLAAPIFIIASGMVLTLEGPQWSSVSSVGHFVNSVHLWSVELFSYVFTVVPLWGKFWMAAWRGRSGR